MTRHKSHIDLTGYDFVSYCHTWCRYVLLRSRHPALVYNIPGTAGHVQKDCRIGLHVLVGIAGSAEGLGGPSRAQPGHADLAPTRNLAWTGDGARRQCAYVHVQEESGGRREQGNGREMRGGCALSMKCSYCHCSWRCKCHCRFAVDVALLPVTLLWNC